jgi:two-component system, OmpR family, phosphate regulon sensor histidine kinase PhoR
MELRVKDDERSTEHEALSSLTHELRTPLACVDGYLAALLDGEAGQLTAEQRAHVAVAQRNARRLARLLDDALAIATPGGGHARGAIGADVGDVVREIAEDLRPLADQRRITLEQDVTGPVSVRADAASVWQVVTNLVENAIKFSPRGSTVHTRVARAGTDAVVEVSDTGAGVPADEIPRLTERSFRGSAARHVPGSGLGLALCAQTARACGGGLEIETREHAGSTMRLRLPALAENGTRARR